MRHIINKSGTPLTITIRQQASSVLQAQQPLASNSFVIKPRGGSIYIKDNDYQASIDLLRPMEHAGKIIIHYTLDEYVETQQEVEDIYASFHPPVRNVNSDTIITAADKYIGVDTSSGIVIITLPATPTTGDHYHIDNAGDGMVRVLGNGYTIAGETQQEFTGNNQSMHIIFNGIEWRII